MEGFWQGSGGRAPQPPEAIRGLGSKPSAQPLSVKPQPPEARGSALGDFGNFSIKIAHFDAYFGQNSYFKAITHQLKAFEKQSKRIK